jgi:radical SAM protein with 4Fe4S-binding SPASM domain
MRVVDKSELLSAVRAKLPDRYWPWQVLWDLTYACQLRCTHCYQMNLDWNVKRQLPTERVLETLDEMRDLGTQELVFSGGDPFVVRDFMTFVERAGANGFQVVIYSSGQGIDNQVARRLVECKVSWVELTLMGADAATHDAVTQRRGSFAKLLDAVRALRVAGVTTVGKTVVTKQNLHQLPRLMELCQELGIEYKCDPHIWKPWNGTEAQIAHLKLDREGMREFYRVYRPPKPQDRTCAMGVTMCNAGRGRVGITPFGKVNPCTTYGEDMVIGDLHEQTFTEIWLNSPMLKRYREMTSKSYPKCDACTMVAFCDWCPGLSSWAGNDYSEPYVEVCNDTEIKKQLWEEDTGRHWVPAPVVNGEPVLIPTITTRRPASG